MDIVSASADRTAAIGKKLAGLLKPGDIVCLRGDLGTGKTVLSRGISQGLGVKGREVISPTFVLMRCHRGRMPMYHFDLYRINGPRDLLGLGCEEFFFSDGVCVIEWAERLGFLEPVEHLRVELSHKDDGRRGLRFTARGGRYRGLLKDLAKKVK